MRCTHIAGLALLACALVAMPVVGHTQEAEPETKAASDLPPISQGQYIAGGLVGTFVGYGIGHAIIGEYGNIGWVFTVTESIATVVMMTGYVMLAFSVMGDPAPGSSGGSSSGDVALGMLAIGALASTGFHIWEVVDVWSRPTDRIVKKGGFGAEGPRVGIIPMAFGDGRVGFMAGITF